MTTPPNQADLETRIVNLAKRLHYHDPKAREANAAPGLAVA